MDFVKIILFISLICGLLAEIKVPAGSCVSRIVNGKLVQVGDCKKDDGSEIARLIQKSLDEKKRAELKCDVTYKLKCYRAVVYDAKNVTFNDAEPICKSMNGNLANVYDGAHLQLWRTYLHPLIPAGQTWINIWTGMEYKDNQLLLSNGEPITNATEVWDPHYPDSDTSRTNVAVIVVKNEASEYQGLGNIDPGWVRHGVICEI
ncbi:uncharacterized protein LOC120335786 isoform X1 [Styela clava]